MFAMPTRLSQESLLVCPLMKRLKALSEMPMASANAACVMLRSRSKSLILSRGLPGFQVSTYAFGQPPHAIYLPLFTARQEKSCAASCIFASEKPIFPRKMQIRRFARTIPRMHL